MFRILQKTYRLDLLWQLIKTNFKMRYQNSILGVLWVLIKPYSTFIVMYLVWSNLQPTGDLKDYPLYLLLGLITYTFFQELIVFGQMSLLERAHIILKISFPRQIATIAALFNALINLGINLIFFFIIMLIRGVVPTLGGLLFYALIIITMFFLSLGIAFITSIVTVKIRDLKNIIDLGLFLLFWLTPIMYIQNTNSLSSKINLFVELNPLTFFINQARAAFGLYSEVNLPVMLVVFGVSVLFCFFTWRYFNSAVKKIAEFF